jgi:phosphoribosylaminoimidazolecarboxamide formyltransferase/IMP cyclohydrolase
MTDATTNSLCKISRALISVSDKTGLIDLARALARHGIGRFSSGGSNK